MIMLTCKRPAFDAEEEEMGKKQTKTKKSEKVEPVLIRTILNVHIFIHAHTTAQHSTQYAIWSANLVFDLHTLPLIVVVPQHY